MPLFSIYTEIQYFCEYDKNQYFAKKKNNNNNNKNPLLLLLFACKMYLFFFHLTIYLFQVFVNMAIKTPVYSIF